MSKELQTSKKYNPDQSLVNQLASSSKNTFWRAQFLVLFVIEFFVMNQKNVVAG